MFDHFSLSFCQGFFCIYNSYEFFFIFTVPLIYLTQVLGTSIWSKMLQISFIYFMVLVKKKIYIYIFLYILCISGDLPAKSCCNKVTDASLRDSCCISVYLPVAAGCKMWLSSYLNCNLWSWGMVSVCSSNPLMSLSSPPARCPPHDRDSERWLRFNGPY